MANEPDLEESLRSLTQRRADFVDAFRAMTADVLVFGRENISVEIEGPDLRNDGGVRVGTSYIEGRLVVLAGKGLVLTPYSGFVTAIDSMMVFLTQGVQVDRRDGQTPDWMDYQIMKDADNASIWHIVVLEFASLFRLMLDVITTVAQPNQPGTWVENLKASALEVVSSIDAVLTRPTPDFTDPRFGFGVQRTSSFFQDDERAIPLKVEDFITADFSGLTPDIALAEIVHVYTHYFTGRSLFAPLSKPWAEWLSSFDIFTLLKESANPLSIAVSKMETFVVTLTGSRRLVTTLLEEATQSIVSYYNTRTPDEVRSIFVPSLVLATARWTVSTPTRSDTFYFQGVLIQGDVSIKDVYETLVAVLVNFREVIVTILDKYGPGNDAQGLAAAAAVVAATHEWLFTTVFPQTLEDLIDEGEQVDIEPSVNLFLQSDQKFHMNDEVERGRFRLALQRLLNLIEQIPQPRAIDIDSPYLAVTDVLDNFAFFIHRKGGNTGLVGRKAYYYCRVMLDAEHTYIRSLMEDGPVDPDGPIPPRPAAEWPRPRAIVDPETDPEGREYIVAGIGRPDGTATILINDISPPALYARFARGKVIREVGRVVLTADSTGPILVKDGEVIGRPDIGVRMSTTTPNTNVELYFTHLESLGALVKSFNDVVVPGWKPSGVDAAVAAFDEALKYYVETGDNKPLAAATTALREFPLRPETAPRLAIVTSFCDSPSAFIL